MQADLTGSIKLKQKRIDLRYKRPLIRWQERAFAPLQARQSVSEICDQFEENSNIILYSDNGSQIYENSDLQFSLPNSSDSRENFSANAVSFFPWFRYTGNENLWKSYLIKRPFSIISNAVGVNSNALEHHTSITKGFDSILPPDLGGPKKEINVYHLACREKSASGVYSSQKRRNVSTRQVKPPHIYSKLINTSMNYSRNLQFIIIYLIKLWSDQRYLQYAAYAYG